MMLHNDKNTPPVPVIQGPIITVTKDPDETCVCCGDKILSPERSEVMSDGAMVISGIGLHSSFGGVVPAAAAFRCGMSRAVELAEWPYFDEDEHEDQSLIGHPALGVSLGFRGIARLLKLGTEALADLGDTVDSASLDPARTGITLVLSPSSSNRDGTPHQVLPRLCKLAGLQFYSASPARIRRRPDRRRRRPRRCRSPNSLGPGGPHHRRLDRHPADCRPHRGPPQD